MRFPQGGGLTPERQSFRERIRMEASERFAAGASNGEIAKGLRVSLRSVQRWRRAWEDAGLVGLRSADRTSLEVTQARFGLVGPRSITRAHEAITRVGHARRQARSIELEMRSPGEADVCG